MIVVTDCQALVYMNGLKTTNSQITRWFDLMQEFDIEVRHQAGTSMTHVDALSRSPTEKSTDTIDKRLVVFSTLIEEQYVKEMQYSDTELLDIIKTLEQPTLSKTVIQNYKLINGILYRHV